MAQEVHYDPLDDYDIPDLPAPLDISFGGDGGGPIPPVGMTTATSHPPDLDDLSEEEVKTKKKPRAKLDEVRLLDEDIGIPVIMRDSPKMRFTCRKATIGQDLDKLMRYYELWSHKLFPRLMFDDCIDKAEAECRKKRLAFNMREWRDQWAREYAPITNSTGLYLDEERDLPIAEDAFFDSDDEERMGAALHAATADVVAAAVPEADEPVEDTEESWPAEFSRASRAPTIQMEGDLSVEMQGPVSDTLDDEEASMPTSHRPSKSLSGAYKRRLLESDEESDEEAVPSVQHLALLAPSSFPAIPVDPMASQVPGGLEEEEEEEEEEDEPSSIRPPRRLNLLAKGGAFASAFISEDEEEEAAVIAKRNKA